ncbi:MAG: phosphatase PAP2 family protein [Candidatus Dormibacteria bacterium]
MTSAPEPSPASSRDDQEGFRSSRFLVPAVITYVVAVTAFLIWRGISVSPDYFVFVLLLGAVVLGRFKAFVVDWMPFVALFLGYEFLRSLAGASGMPVHYREVIDADRILGFGQLPTLWLQARLYHPGSVGPLDIIATIFYFCHFAYPLTLGYVFWINDRVHFRRFAAALLVMSFSAFAFFLLVPVAPPWLASQMGYLPHVEKIINHTLPSATTPFYQGLNPNKVAAFPSLHTAFPVLGALYGARLFGWRAWPLWLWVVGVVFSIVYLGEHYLVDAVAGAALALVFFALIEAAWAWRLRRRRAVKAW